MVMTRKNMIVLHRVIILLFAVQLVGAINEQYDGDKVFEVKSDPKNVDKIKMINDYANSNKMDVWKEFDGITGTCMLRVSESKFSAFKEFCTSNNVEMKETVSDVKLLIDQNVESLGQYGCFDYNAYNRFEDIRRELKRQFYCNQNVMKLSCIGWSDEGRPLIIAKLSFGINSYFQKKKPIMWIDAGMHAREWISMATAMFIINRFLILRHSNADINRILTDYEVWIIPVFNPDGYEYSINTDRLWRKTRAEIEGSECFGIDPNRNFNNQWGGIGSSSDPCSELYRGKFPEEAKCVKAFSNQLRNIKNRLSVYFSLHSFFQLLLLPNAYTPVPPSDAKELIAFGIRFRNGVSKRYKTTYNIGPAQFVSKPHSGNSPDYVHDVLNITHAYLIELRDRGQFGFLLPPDQIAPTALETLDGIFADLLMGRKSEKKKKNSVTDDKKDKKQHSSPFKQYGWAG